MTHHDPDHLSTASAEASVPASTRAVLAPVAGAVVPLAELGDPVFSSGAMGHGAGIRPTDGTVVAPIDGEVVAAMPHAYGISGGGVEVLVHVGIDTVELGGAPFAPAVQAGQLVRAGDLLVTADLAAISAAGVDTTTIVVVTNSATLEGVEATVAVEVGRGDALLEVTL